MLLFITCFNNIFRYHERGEGEARREAYPQIFFFVFKNVYTSDIVLVQNMDDTC